MIKVHKAYMKYRIAVNIPEISGVFTLEDASQGDLEDLWNAGYLKGKAKKTKDDVSESQRVELPTIREQQEE